MALIRTATHHDARELAQLAERTFRDTFAAANTAADMDLHSNASYSQAIQASEIADPRLVTLVCSENNTLVGFAQLRWKKAPVCVVAATPGEIQRLYIDREWHGRGLAQALMQACLDEMHTQQSDVVWLGVWEHNPRAISFYRKFGFIEVGEHSFHLGHDLQRDIVMARPVHVLESGASG